MRVACSLFWLQKAPPGSTFGFNGRQWRLMSMNALVPPTISVAGAFLRVYCNTGTERDRLFRASGQGYVSTSEHGELFGGEASFCGGAILKLLDAKSRVLSITARSVNVSLNRHSMDYFLDLSKIDAEGNPSVRPAEDFPVLREAVPEVFARILESASTRVQPLRGSGSGKGKHKRPTPPKTHSKDRREVWT